MPVGVDVGAPLPELGPQRTSPAATALTPVPATAKAVTAPSPAASVPGQAMSGQSSQTAPSTDYFARSPRKGW